MKFLLLCVLATSLPAMGIAIPTFQENVMAERDSVEDYDILADKREPVDYYPIPVGMRDSVENYAIPVGKPDSVAIELFHRCIGEYTNEETNKAGFVFKAGRISGPIIGQLHSTDTIVCMRQHGKIRTTTTERAILPAPIHGYCSMSFADAGEPGALAYNALERFGVAWGGMNQSKPSISATMATSKDNEGWYLHLPSENRGVNTGDLMFYTLIKIILDPILSDLDHESGQRNFRKFGAWAASSSMVGLEFCSFEEPT